MSSAERRRDAKWSSHSAGASMDAPGTAAASRAARSFMSSPALGSTVTSMTRGSGSASAATPLPSQGLKSAATSRVGSARAEITPGVASSSPIALAIRASSASSPPAADSDELFAPASRRVLADGATGPASAASSESGGICTVRSAANASFQRAVAEPIAIAPAKARAARKVMTAIVHGRKRLESSAPSGRMRWRAIMTRRPPAYEGRPRRPSGGCGDARSATPAPRCGWR